MLDVKLGSVVKRLYWINIYAKQGQMLMQLYLSLSIVICILIYLRKFVQFFLYISITNFYHVVINFQLIGIQGGFDSTELETDRLLLLKSERVPVVHFLFERLAARRIVSIVITLEE